MCECKIYSIFEMLLVKYELVNVLKKLKEYDKSEDDTGSPKRIVMCMAPMVDRRQGLICSR